MSKVNTQWQAGRCRTETGVFFKDDSGMLVTGSLTEGYTVAPRQPMGALFDAYSEHWAEFEENRDCRAEAKGLFINAGRGASGDSAYIAVIDAATAQLVWVAHLPDCPPIAELSVTDSRILAQPADREQSIEAPLQSPGELLVHGAAERPDSDDEE